MHHNLVLNITVVIILAILCIGALSYFGVKKDTFKKSIWCLSAVTGLFFIAIITVLAMVTTGFRIF